MPPARRMHTGARLVCLLTCNLGTRIFTSSWVRQGLRSGRELSYGDKGSAPTIRFHAR
jgi:hypothetical protein